MEQRIKMLSGFLLGQIGGLMTRCSNQMETLCFCAVGRWRNGHRGEDSTEARDCLCDCDGLVHRDGEEEVPSRDVCTKGNWK
jgi:hypothetical protein